MSADEKSIRVFGPEAYTKGGRLRSDVYEAELLRLQIELVTLLEWIKLHGLRVVVLFEGRDAAGKGDVIKRITESTNPRVVRVVALGTPSDREKTQWYFQRYVQHLPSAGEIVMFDRSWYTRSGVERVMGFCEPSQYEEFLKQAPAFEKLLVNDGIDVVKFWFSVSRSEQLTRFAIRQVDPVRQWKLSPMDLQSRIRWEAYTKAKEEMLERTNIPEAPWYIVPGNDKKRARLNCMAHLLTQIPYGDVPHHEVSLPDRVFNPDYEREVLPPDLYVPRRY